MPTYALWNNKGGVGKSYLTFQIASEYARIHPEHQVLVVDLCPQADASSMLLGGMYEGESRLNELLQQSPRRSVAGYIRERIVSPYQDTHTGSKFLHRVADSNPHVPDNLYLVSGDHELELLSARVRSATSPGPDDAWAKVHLWIRNLISDIKQSWNGKPSTVFIDCNPSFGIYTELALSAADRLIIPFSADGSSKRAVTTLLSLLYGIAFQPGLELSEYVRYSDQFSLRVPRIYCYVGNRLTQYRTSAKAFKTVVQSIGDAIWRVWQNNSSCFEVHNHGLPRPNNRSSFQKLFQFEIVDANSASVVSSALGIPIVKLSAGQHLIAGKKLVVNQTQLDKQQPNIKDLVARIE
jgi:chromosome partitioning protein